MQCRHCGTEIAEKAIICFRCGQGTTDPVRRPVPIRPAGRGWPSLLVPVLAILLSLVLFSASDESGYPGAMTTAAGILACAGAFLIARVIRRR